MMYYVVKMKRNRVIQGEKTNFRRLIRAKDEAAAKKLADETAKMHHAEVVSVTHHPAGR